MDGCASPYLSVIVPAYNESRVIVDSIRSIQTYLNAQDYGYEIIVSADGDDGTREKAAEYAAGDPRIHVIGSAERGGKGRGIRQGVMMARGDVIGFLDADYKTPIDEVAAFLPLLAGGCDMVIGSRHALPAPPPRSASRCIGASGSIAFSLLMHRLLKLGDIRDTQCGFKFFRRQTAREIFSRQKIDGYMFDIEILRIARAMNYRIEQVGVRWRDDNDSRYELVSGTWRNARELLKICASPVEVRQSQAA